MNFTRRVSEAFARATSPGLAQSPEDYEADEDEIRKHAYGSRRCVVALAALRFSASVLSIFLDLLPYLTYFAAILTSVARSSQHFTLQFESYSSKSSRNRPKRGIKFQLNHEWTGKAEKHPV